MGGNHFCLSQRKGSYKNASKRTKGCKRTKQQYRDMNLKRWANKTPKEALPIELDQAEDCKKRKYVIKKFFQPFLARITPFFSTKIAK